MGAVLIGTLMSSILLGIMYIQSFYYFIDCQMDMWYLKSLVVSTVVLDMVHMLLISHSSVTPRLSAYCILGRQW
ncbi:hypothetical protein L208DRAFT_1418051 [Tricholoma matsutake]|nr:hypothetical protein L208DRAFT_1418051 [Tricholoma matsutake 945]